MCNLNRGDWVNPTFSFQESRRTEEHVRGHSRRKQLEMQMWEIVQTEAESMSNKRKEQKIKKQNKKKSKKAGTILKEK